MSLSSSASLPKITTSKTIDVILTNQPFQPDNLSPLMDLARALYDSAELVQNRVGDTDDIDKAMDFLDNLINKILKYREDLQ